MRWYTTIGAALLVWIAIGPDRGAAAEDAPTERAVAAHAAMVARIRTAHIRIEQTAHVKGEVPKLMSSSETWRSGSRERSIKRVLTVLTRQGWHALPLEQQVTQFGFSDDESRSLRGWDPENPYPLPLDETKAARHFGEVKGAIGPRDPLGGTSHDWTQLLLEVHSGWPLQRFLAAARWHATASEAPSQVRLVIDETEFNHLKGSAIDLDAEHGFAISRIERAAEPSLQVVVEDFQSFGDDIWIPRRIRRMKGPLAIVTEMVSAEVNEPMKDQDLLLDFPQGARVDDASTGRVHLWGRGEPAMTFKDFARFHEHQMSQMRAAQVAPLDGTAWLTSWLLWVNLSGVGLLFVLFFVRKKWMAL